VERLPWRAAVRRPQLSLVNAPDMLPWPILVEFARVALPPASLFAFINLALAPIAASFFLLSDF